MVKRNGKSGGRTGLYGSQVGDNMVRTAVAEVIGTFMLVFTGTAVATAALLGRPTAGAFYDSLAIAVIGGLPPTSHTAKEGTQ